MIAVSSGLVLAQSSYMDFGVGARNASLANANISESADVSSMYENPGCNCICRKRFGIPEPFTGKRVPRHAGKRRGSSRPS